jgi:hypothetical protein
MDTPMVVHSDLLGGVPTVKKVSVDQLTLKPANRSACRQEVEVLRDPGAVSEFVLAAVGPAAREQWRSPQEQLPMVALEIFRLAVVQCC